MLHAPRRLVLLLSLLIVGHSRNLSAQGGPVVEVSYAKQFDAVGIGGGYGFALGQMTTQTGIWGQATLDYFFVDKFHELQPIAKDVSHSYYEFNMNFVKVTGGIPGLYVGPGLNYSTERIDQGNYGGSEGGANLGVSAIAGLHFGPMKQASFIQARYEFGGGKQFVLSAGLAF